MKKYVKKIISLSLIALLMFNTSFATVGHAANKLTIMMYVSKTLSGYLANLDSLMAQCEEQGIPTDYEKVTYTVLERWKEYLNDDIQNSYFDIFDTYTKVQLDNMYNEAKADLEGYLDGTKQAFSVPRYVTSDMDIEGYTVTADTVNSEGVKERRPVYFIGYGHFEEARNDIPNFQSFGANTIQNEIGPNEVIINSNAWQFFVHSADAAIEYTDKVKNSGDNVAKITNKTALTPGVFSAFSQPVSLEPSTEYTLSLSVKAENMKNTQLSWNGGANRFNIPDGTYDWTELSYDFLTDSTVQSGDIWLCVQDITDACYIDDIRLTKKGGTENIVRNGNFDDITPSRNGDYYIDKTAADRIARMLEQADKSNIAVCLLVSPHYFPKFLFDVHPEMKVDFGEGENVTSSEIPHHEKTLEVLEVYLRTLIPRIKDYKSLNSICLTNEPGFVPAAYGDFYKPMWIEFLKEKYDGNLASLNAAYGASYGDWAEVPLMSSFESGSAINYDNQLFAREVQSDWHKFLANIIHEIAPDIPLHSKAQGYINGIEKWTNYVYRSSDFEYSNEFSDLAGCDYSIEYSGIVTNQHKPLYESLWYDYMAGIGGKPVINSEDHVSCDGEENFIPEQALWMRTNMWQGAMHHRAFSQLWVWKKSYDKNNIYYGSLLFRPDCIKTIGQTNLDLNRLSYETDAIVSSAEDVAILYSSASRQYVPEHIESLYCGYESALFNGKKVKVVTEKGIEKINGCKVLIVPSCTNVPADAVREIYGFMQNGGNVIIMGSSSLSKDEHNNAYSADVLSLASQIKSNSKVIPVTADGYFISSPTRRELADTFETYFKEQGLQNIWLVDASTGERIAETEWMTADYDGNKIINICNYTIGTPKTVKLVMNGNTVSSSINMVSGEQLGESFTINPYDPVLVKIDMQRPSEADNVKVSVGANNTIISWKNNDERITGVNIYSADGVLLNAVTGSSCIMANSSLSDTVIIKAVDAVGNESYGVPVTVAKTKVFSVDFNAERAGNAVKYSLTVTNNEGSYAAADIMVLIKDANGNIIDASMNKKLVDANGSITFSGSFGNRGAGASTAEAVVVSSGSVGTALSDRCTINLNTIE